MPSLWIHSRETLAKLSSERVVISPLNDASDLERERSIPLIDVDLVVAGPTVHISSPLLRQLLERGIPTLFLDGIGRPLGQCIGTPPAHPRIQLKQYQLQATELSEASNQVAAVLIGAKIYNQRRILQRLRHNRDPGSESTSVEMRLSQALTSLEKATTHTAHETLLGIEGSTTADFYSAWKTYLPSDFPFERRSRRPPLNPVNACLSFISTLLYQEMLVACFVAGLDPALGHLHLSQDGRWSLPLDLIEPLRPLLTESITLELMSRGQLDDDHFEPKAGGIYLNHKGRSKVILSYEKRLERYFQSEHLGQRTSLRQVLRQAPLDYKAHLNELRPLAPFRMN